jgi:hypothetical protein
MQIKASIKGYEWLFVRKEIKMIQIKQYTECAA